MKKIFFMGLIILINFACSSTRPDKKYKRYEKEFFKLTDKIFTSSDVEVLENKFKELKVQIKSSDEQKYIEYEEKVDYYLMVLDDLKN